MRDLARDIGPARSRQDIALTAPDDQDRGALAQPARPASGLGGGNGLDCAQGQEDEA